MEEANRTLTRYLELVQAINRTNASTPFREGVSLSDALAERETIGKKRDLLTQVVEAASLRQDRYSRSEVKYISTVPVADLQKQADQLSKQFRELDTRIQEWNWKIDIS